MILPLSPAMFLTHLAARINLSPIRRVFSDQSRRLRGTDGSRCREWSRPILPNTAITNARLSRRDISQYDGLACRDAKGTPMFARLSNSCTAAIFPCDTRRYFYATVVVRWRKRPQPVPAIPLRPATMDLFISPLKRSCTLIAPMREKKTSPVYKIRLLLIYGAETDGLIRDLGTTTRCMRLVAL